MDTNYFRPIADTNSIKDNVMPYVSKWHWFVITLFISLLAVWIYLDNATPQYKISSTLLVPDSKKDDGMLKATAFSDLNMFHESKTVDNEIEILRSRDLIYKVLKKLNLETKYFKRNGFTTKELYGKQLPFIVSATEFQKAAFYKKINLQSLSDTTYLLEDGDNVYIYRFGQTVKQADYKFEVNKGPAYDNKHQSVKLQFKDLHKMAQSFSAGLLQVNPIVKESNTISLSMIDAVPSRGVDIMTNIIDTYNNENVQKNNLMAVNTIIFIDKRLKVMEEDFSHVEKDIESYKEQHNTVDADAGAQINLTRSAEYKQMLEESDIQLGVVNSISSYLTKAENQYNAVISTMGLKDPVLNTLINRFNDLQLERNRMLHSADMSNPLVKNLSNQIAGLRVNILESLKNVKQGIIIQNRHLKTNSANYLSRIRSVPALERGLLQRSREQSVKTSLYQYLLQKREETALSLSATIPIGQLIDRPAYNPVPEYPKQPLMYICGGIFGLMMPLFFIYARQKLNVKVVNTSSLKNISGIKILGELSHNGIKSPVAINKGSKSTISELFRYIRTNLSVLNGETVNKIMLVTSCMKGEGKTFFSINFGLTLALLNKKVLIIEFDLRKPDLLQKLGVSQDTGVSDFLQGDTDSLMQSIHPYSKASNLYLLGCGALPQNPAELLMDQRVDILFNRLKSQFDYIIVDTSPVGAVADAFSLAKYADMSIYLVRYNYTTTEQLEILKDIHDHNKLKNLMVVLNDAKPENRPVYAYGAEY